MLEQTHKEIQAEINKLESKSLALANLMLSKQFEQLSIEYQQLITRKITAINNYLECLLQELILKK